MWGYGWSFFLDALEAGYQADLERARLTALAVRVGNSDDHRIWRVFMAGDPAFKPGGSPKNPLDAEALMRKMGKFPGKKNRGSSQ